MGALEGVRIVEVGGIGPGPFCGMMLSDMGADIVRIDRKGHRGMLDAKYDVLLRGRPCVGLDLSKKEGVDAVLGLVERAHALYEGFRPGVMEELGLGPDVCLKRNPRLVYGRMTGWGQEGPLARVAGHDINYISLSGALHTIGRPDTSPVPPLNLVGDFGGGGMLLAFGMVCALYEARKSGQGQVIDAAMVDGSAALMAMVYGMHAAGSWVDRRGANLADGGAPFYDAYETADGKWVSVGSIEPQFYSLLLKRTGLEDPEFQPQMDRSKWPRLKEKVAAVFKSKSREQWCALMEGSDVCFAPVLTLGESLAHPHNLARKVFLDVEGVMQPAPAPRFSRTPGQIQAPPSPTGARAEKALMRWGFDGEQIQALRQAGVME